VVKFILPFLLLITSISCFCQDSVRCNLYNRYKISAVKTGKKNENLIKILDQQLNQKFDWGVVQNCYCNHYHFAEFHDSSLYVIKEFDYNTPLMRRELWKYTKEKSEMLISAIGIDFRVNSKQTYLAYIVGRSYYEEVTIDTLFILNLIDKKLDKIVLPAEFIKNIQDSVKNLISPDNFRIDDICWATNSDVLWGIVTQTCIVYGLFSYNCLNGKLETYLPPQDIAAGYSLNPNKGTLIYTTCPFTFDSSDKEDFEKSNKEASLFTYDISKRKKTLIVTAQGHFFYPYLICEDIVEYTDPITHSRKRVLLGQK
jgi:hypothetical protein